MKNKIQLIAALVLLSLGTQAQKVDMSKVNSEYIKVLEGRTEKFLQPMELGDKYDEIQQIVIEQYCNLSAIHDSLDARKQQVRDMGLPNEERDFRIDALKDQRDRNLYIRHNAYIAQLLGAGMTYEQVDQIKDGMTYSVMPNTYAAFVDMIQELTDEQKKQIWVWLYEARERAIDQGSSKEKHKMFGKYKGRINNYLSKEGYDLKTQSEAWEERLRKQGKKL